MASPPAGRARVTPLIGEVFRERGFEGASLSCIGHATGLGKGSLYNFFPGGKAEMANAVLDEIEVWFEREVFAPLMANEPDAIERMLESVDAYFRSGRRVCLVGAFALDDSRARFAHRIAAYFERWIAVLAHALACRGFGRKKARTRAEEIVASIQGGIVIARALDDDAAFVRLMTRLQRRVRKQEP